MKYGSLYLNLKTNSKSALAYTSIYLLRRLILCMSIMLFSENPLSQIVVALLSSLGMITYLLVVKPHRSPNTRMFELFNETTILVVTYLLMMNIDLITDDQLKFTNGWGVLAIISACILSNLINVVTNMAIKIKRKIQSFIRQRRIQKSKIESASFKYVCKQQTPDRIQMHDIEPQIQHQQVQTNFGINNTCIPIEDGSLINHYSQTAFNDEQPSNYAEVIFDNSTSISAQPSQVCPPAVEERRYEMFEQILQDIQQPQVNKQNEQHYTLNENNAAEKAKNKIPKDQINPLKEWYLEKMRSLQNMDFAGDISAANPPNEEQSTNQQVRTDMTKLVFHTDQMIYLQTATNAKYLERLTKKKVKKAKKQ